MSFQSSIPLQNYILYSLLSSLWSISDRVVPFVCISSFTTVPLWFSLSLCLFVCTPPVSLIINVSLLYANIFIFLHVLLTLLLTPLRDIWLCSLATPTFLFRWLFLSVLCVILVSSPCDLSCLIVTCTVCVSPKWQHVTCPAQCTTLPPALFHHKFIVIYSSRIYIFFIYLCVIYITFFVFMWVRLIGGAVFVCRLCVCLSYQIPNLSACHWKREKRKEEEDWFTLEASSGLARLSCVLLGPSALDWTHEGKHNTIEWSTLLGRVLGAVKHHICVFHVFAVCSIGTRLGLRWKAQTHTHAHRKENWQREDILSVVTTDAPNTSSSLWTSCLVFNLNQIVIYQLSSFHYKSLDVPAVPLEHHYSPVWSLLTDIILTDIFFAVCHNTLLRATVHLIFLLRLSVFFSPRPSCRTRRLCLAMFAPFLDQTRTNSFEWSVVSFGGVYCLDAFADVSRMTRTDRSPRSSRPCSHHRIYLLVTSHLRTCLRDINEHNTSLPTSLGVDYILCQSASFSASSLSTVNAPCYFELARPVAPWQPVPPGHSLLAAVSLSFSRPCPPLLSLSSSLFTSMLILWFKLN